MRSGPATPRPLLLLFDQIGGEIGVAELVEHFYELVETLPQARPLLDLHLQGHGIAHSCLELFRCLCGFLGGPRYYVERHGHSDIRRMHAHVKIDGETRDIWLTTMARALDDLGIAAEVKARLMLHFGRAAHQIHDSNAAARAAA